MANYALGYPVVTGCHTAHRMVALAAMGGLAAHDADDLLITLRYRAAGWRGCMSRRSWGVLGYAAPVVGALTLADVYRQRFYLGGRDEWGLHWPAAVLGFAKWPYMLLALCEVLIGYRGPSILTRKIGRASRHSLLLVATHGLTAAAVAATSVLGTLAQHVSLSTAHLSSALVLASALGVIASERLPYPEPYDPRLPKDWA